MACYRSFPSHFFYLHRYYLLAEYSRRGALGRFQPSSCAESSPVQTHGETNKPWQT